MRILLTGANGQVGWELSNRGGQRGFEVLALDRADLDITDPVSVSGEVNRSGVSLVVNAAGYTAVDEAESRPELAFAAIVVDTPSNLLALKKSSSDSQDCIRQICGIGRTAILIGNHLDLFFFTA